MNYWTLVTTIRPEMLMQSCGSRRNLALKPWYYGDETSSAEDFVYSKLKEYLLLFRSVLTVLAVITRKSIL